MEFSWWNEKFNINLFVLQEMAELEGDHEKSQQLQTELDELEERADLLDKQRSQSINSIR